MKKRILSFLLAALLIIGCTPFSFAAAAIEISTPEQFLAIRNDLAADYKLTSDITFPESMYAAGGALENGFLPFGLVKQYDELNGYSYALTPFSGTFDGDGHSIFGLQINVESTADLHCSNAAIFAANAGTIQNTGFYGSVNLHSTESSFSVFRVGAFAALNNGTIRGCANYGSITANTAFTSQIGGITGETTGTVSNCFNNGTIEYAGASNVMRMGGIVGYTGAAADIERCVTTGALISPQSLAGKTLYIGNLIGYNNGKITHSYALNTTAKILGADSAPTAVRNSNTPHTVTAETAKLQATFAELDFTNTWKMGTASPELKNISSNTVTVSFDMNGHGTQIEAQTVVKGGKVTKPADPTEAGYTFGGWYYDKATTARVYFTTDTFKSDATLYAKWTKVPTYTVTFDANGGSVTPTSAETGTDGKLATLPTPTRSGYSFVGWYTIGDTKIDTNTVFTAAATIYAHWSRSFSFAHLPETGVATITVPEGDYYTGVAAKDAFILYWDENIKTDGNFILIDYFYTYNNGYHSWTITIENGVAVATDGGFAEYYTTLDLINNDPFYASYDKWVNGTYSAIHTVTVQNDGNGTASANPTSAAKGDTVTLTAVPNEGYHFKEWQSSDVTVNGNTFTMPENDVIIKAIFEEDAPNAYTVSFNMNGHGSAIAAQSVTAGGKATKPTDPTASGWVFGGWYTTATFNVPFDFNAVINADTTVYAKWTKSSTDCGGDPAKCALTKFTDAPKYKNWAHPGVEYAVKRGLFGGTSPTTFEPNTNMTRGMFVTVLGRLAGVSSKGAATKFTDVKKSAYYSGYVKWASDKGIVGGTSATTFEPDANVTREQICKMMTEYCNAMGITLVKSKPEIKFADAAKISKWARDYVKTCQMAGLVNGKENNRFDPAGNATRAEVATILYNFNQNYSE